MAAILEPPEPMAADAQRSAGHAVFHPQVSREPYKSAAVQSEASPPDAQEQPVVQEEEAEQPQPQAREQPLQLAQPAEQPQQPQAPQQAQLQQEPQALPPAVSPPLAEPSPAPQEQRVPEPLELEQQVVREQSGSERPPPRADAQSPDPPAAGSQSRAALPG